MTPAAILAQLGELGTVMPTQVVTFENSPNLPSVKMRLRKHRKSDLLRL